MMSLIIDSSHAWPLVSLIIDDLELIERFRQLRGPELKALIDETGLEESAPLLALMSRTQLMELAHEELWASDEAGLDASLDLERLHLWFEVLSELGPADGARCLLSMDDEFVILALSKIVHVFDLESLTAAMELEYDATSRALIEKAMESCYALELDRWLLLFSGGYGWESAMEIMVHLFSHDPYSCEELLEQLAWVSDEKREESGGIHELLTNSEMLEQDVGQTREQARAGSGYVAPSQARSFLRYCSVTSLEKLASEVDDPVSRAYFRDLSHSEDAAASLSHLKAILHRAGSARQVSRTRALPSGGVQGDFRELFAELREAAPQKHATRLAELSFLANILMAGEAHDGRPYRQQEAMDEVLRLLEAGMAQVAGEPTVQAPAARMEIFTDHSLITLFKVGRHLDQISRDEGRD